MDNNMAIITTKSLTSAARNPYLAWNLYQYQMHAP